jgi:hypothetical protein
MTLLVNFTDMGAKRLILSGPSTRVRVRRSEPLIKTASAYAESRTEHLNRVIVLHFFDPLVALEGPSQTMPSVFLESPAVGSAPRSVAVAPG